MGGHVMRTEILAAVCTAAVALAGGALRHVTVE
jgi:hypothetical protein